MRLRTASLIVPGILFLLVGCSAPVVDGPMPTEAPAAVEALPMDLVAPQVLPDVLLGPGSGEPNIAVAPDGTIYVTPIDHLYRSTDAGKSFTALGEPGCNAPTFGVAPCPAGSEDTIAVTDGHGDGDIAIDATGRLHWLGLFGRSGAIPYQHSDDKGATFSPGIDLSSPTFDTSDGTGADREWIDATPDGWIYTAWRDSSQQGSIVFRGSDDLGNTWKPLTHVAADRLTGPIIHGPTPGSAYMAFTAFDASPPLPMVGGATTTFRIELAKSHDHGATWNVSTVLTPPQPVVMQGLVDEGTVIFPIVAADDNGTLYVLWSSSLPTEGQYTARSASRFGVSLVVSHDDGATWSDPVLLSDPARSSLLPFAVGGAGGRLVVVWYENTLGNPSDNAPDLWNVRLWESTDADAARSHVATAQLNVQPNHIGSVCTTGGACLFTAGDRSLLDYFEVALDNQGQAVVTWASSAGGTAVGVAAQPVMIHFGGVVGTPLSTHRT